MSITPQLDGFHGDPDAERVIGLTLEMARVALGLADNFANGIIAKQIIELAEGGERLVRQELAAGMKALSASPKSPAPVSSQADICPEKEWGCVYFARV